MANFLAPTPQPPYFAAIFASERTPDASEEYAATAALMSDLAQQQPGFLGIESVRNPDGQGLTVSYWQSLDAISDWKSHADHRLAQQAGRSLFYQRYTLRIARVERDQMYDREHPDVNIVRPDSGIRSFQELADSRKAWIQDELRPWCQRACRRDLLLAEHEWHDIAGKADPVKTLWAWAWSRFPELVHEDLGINETTEVVVQLAAGMQLRGYPDARQSQHGQLVLFSMQADGKWQFGEPVSIDDITSVQHENPA